MTCKSCGCENDSTSAFCYNCGAKLEQPQKKPKVPPLYIAAAGAVLVLLFAFILLPRLIDGPSEKEPPAETALPVYATPAYSEEPAAEGTAVRYETIPLYDEGAETNTMLTPLMNLELYNDGGFVLLFQGFSKQENSYGQPTCMVFDMINTSDRVYGLWSDTNTDLLNGHFFICTFGVQINIEPGQARREYVSAYIRPEWLPVRFLHLELDIHTDACHYIYPSFYFDESGAATTQPIFSGAPVDLGDTRGVAMKYLGAIHNGDSIMGFFEATNNTDESLYVEFTGASMDGAELKVDTERYNRSISPGETVFVPACVSYPAYEQMPYDIGYLTYNYEVCEYGDPLRENRDFTVNCPIFD